MSPPVRLPRGLDTKPAAQLAVTRTSTARWWRTRRRLTACRCAAAVNTLPIVDAHQRL